MKKPLITLLFLISAILLNSQTILVSYDVKINKNDDILSKISDYDLIISNDKSAYYNDFNNVKEHFKYKDFIDNVKKIGELKLVKIGDEHYEYVAQEYYFKDYKENKLIFNKIIANKRFVVSEKIDLFEWEIIAKSDTLILNQKCQKAITKFRGRNYTAYFSNELIGYGGPWKFDGLPGLILYVKSDNNYFVIEPIKIESLKEEENIRNHFEKEKKSISWEKYKSLYKKDMIAALNRLRAVSSDGEGGSIEITDMIEDLDIKKVSF